MKMLFLIAPLLFVAFLFSACQNAISISFEDRKIVLDRKDIITLEQVEAVEEMAIASNLTLALQESKVLDIKLTTSKIAKDGFWAFSIDAPEDKELIIELFDEEAFEQLGKRSISVKKGLNNKALNVNEYENGNYIIRIKDFHDSSEQITAFEIKND